METRTMLPRFTPPSAIRDLQLLAYQVRRLRPGRRPRDRTRRRFRLDGLEDRCLLSFISAIAEFPLPSGSSLPLVVGSITTGPDGNIWFGDLGDSAIGMMNPTTHSMSLFTIPATGGAGSVTTGPDGNVWFTEHDTNAIGMINPTSHAVSSFALPSGTNTTLNITAGPNGNLWFTASGGSKVIGEINPTTHAITEFPLSSPYVGPNDITAGPDGNVWFTWNGAGEVGKINPTTGAVTYFTVGGAPTGITPGPDGNLWFTFSPGTDVGNINPTTDAISLFATPTVGSQPDGITTGPDGNLWFTESSASKIASINPTTDAITEYSIPYFGSTPYGMTTGPDGNLWFVDPGTNAIGVATLTSSELVVTTQPPSSVTAGTVFGLTADAENSSGNLITSFNGTVTVALANNLGAATLGGTLSVTASDGVATFSNLSLTKAASGYTLDVSASGLAGATTTAITVTPAAATQLAITTQPDATVKVNSAFGLQASIEDQYGNVVTTATSTVNVAFANNPTGATLGGTVAVTANQGVATFSGLTINKTGNGYTLQVSSSGLTSATTSAVNVTKTGKDSIIAGTPGTTAPDPLLAPLVLDSPDFLDCLGLKKHARTI
jgi:streptogramin lyase